jgi:hypothetical protein
VISRVGGRRNGQCVVQTVCRGSGHGASPWPRRVVRRNSGAVRNRRQATATSPPLGGVSVCFRGRSSDSAGSTLLAGLPSALRHQCHLGLSYLLTAAGQFRILTGFPFDAPCGATMEKPLYLGFLGTASPLDVDILLKRRVAGAAVALVSGERDSASYAPSPLSSKRPACANSCSSFAQSIPNWVAIGADSL